MGRRGGRVFLTTVTTLRELVLTNPELTMFVAILYVSTKVAFGSDNEDRYNPLGDMTKYFNSAVATVQDVVPVLSAKKDKAAASPKAGGAPAPAVQSASNRAETRIE